MDIGIDGTRWREGGRRVEWWKGRGTRVSKIGGGRNTGSEVRLWSLFNVRVVNDDPVEMGEADGNWLKGWRDEHDGIWFGLVLWTAIFFLDILLGEHSLPAGVKQYWWTLEG